MLKGKAKIADNITKELESEGARVLRVVRYKMAERARLLQEMVCTPSMMLNRSFFLYFQIFRKQILRQAARQQFTSSVQGC